MCGLTSRAISGGRVQLVTTRGDHQKHCCNVKVGNNSVSVCIKTCTRSNIYGACLQSPDDSI